MIKHVFLDLDDTLLDFHKAEAAAIEKTMRAFGIAVTEENAACYSRINKGCWEALERGEITRAQLRRLRFERFFAEVKAEGAERASDVYERYLSEGHYFVAGAEALLASLFGKYKLYLATNGLAAVQAGRVASAGIEKYFEARFVSEEIGFNKPSLEYFEACFQRIGGFRREEAVIVGDSLTSDIKGGIAAGIKTVWFNPKGLPESEAVRPDAQISALCELMDLLEKM